MNRTQAKQLVEKCLSSQQSQQVIDRDGDIFGQFWVKTNGKEIFALSGAKWFLYQLEIVESPDAEPTTENQLSTENQTRESEEKKTMFVNRTESPDGYKSVYLTRHHTTDNDQPTLSANGSAYGTAIIKVLDRKGKGEILSATDDSILVKGRILNSNMLLEKSIGSTWLCEIDIPNVGSRKIKTVSRWDKSPDAYLAESESDQSPDSNGSVASQNAPQASIPVAPSSANVPTGKSLKSVDPDSWVESDYYISPDAKKVFGAAYRMLCKRPNKSVKILLSGDSGFGKTTLAERAANFLGLRFMRMNCATLRDTEEWFVDRAVISENGASVTKFIPSEFSRVVQQGNVIIVLDELNRVSPELHNSLFPLLDDSGKTTVHDQEIIVGDNVIFVSTINQGYAYTGTFQLDQAVINRHQFCLEISAMPMVDEIELLITRCKVSYTDAESIVLLATKLRDSELSCPTRSTLLIADMMTMGELSIRESFEYAIIRRIPSDESSAPIRKIAFDLINTQLGTL